MALAVLEAALALRAELARFDPGLLRGPDSARVAEELAATEKACAAARLVSAAHAVDAGAHLDYGFKDGASWLARQSGSTTKQAQRDLATANRLDDCPDTKTALLTGDISIDQAHEITQAEAETPGVEGALLPVARSADLSRLRDEACQQRQARTPIDDLHAAQRKARFFRHWRNRLGNVCFSGELPPETGVPFISRVEQEAARARREARAAHPNVAAEAWAAYAADGLSGLYAGDQARRSARAELVIVCDLRAWRRGHAHPGEAVHVIGGGPIPVSVARDLSQDAFLKAVLHEGVAIRTVKHIGRHIPAELRTALDLGPVPELTGRQCAECGKRWGLQYDHVDPVGNRGPTSYENLQALCWADHQSKTKRDRRAGLLRGDPSRSPPDDP